MSGNAVQWVELPPDMPWARVGSWRDGNGTPCIVLTLLPEDDDAAEVAITVREAQALARGITEAVAHAGG